MSTNNRDASSEALSRSGVIFILSSRSGNGSRLSKGGRMDSRIRLLFVAVVLLAVSAAGVRAQEATVISGQITTKADGLSLPGATVAIPSLNVSAVTDQEGRYTLNIPGGVVKGQLVEMQATFPG